MSISTTFKLVGNKIKESFTTATIPKKETNLSKMIKRLEELELKELKEKESTPTNEDEVTVDDVIQNSNSKEQATDVINDMIENITPQEKIEAINKIKQSSLLDKVKPITTPKKVTYKFDMNLYKNKSDAKTELCRQWIKSGSDMSNEDYQTIKTQIESSDLPGFTVTNPPDTTSDNNSILKNSGFTILDHNDELNFSVIKPHFFVKEDFYLLYDGGVCYLQTKLKNAPYAEYQIPVELVVLTDGGQSNPSSISSGGTNFKFRNLTQSEYSELITSKPTLEYILKVYQKKHSETTGFGGGDTRLKKIFLNINNSIPVF